MEAQADVVGLKLTKITLATKEEEELVFEDTDDTKTFTDAYDKSKLRSKVRLRYR